MLRRKIFRAPSRLAAHSSPRERLLLDNRHRQLRLLLPQQNNLRANHYCKHVRWGGCNIAEVKNIAGTLQLHVMLFREPVGL